MQTARLSIIEIFTRRSSSAERALAASLASELRQHSEVVTWLLTLARLGRTERTGALVSAARQFRGEWSTFGVADALARLAARPALFRAVAASLETNVVESALLPDFAQAA